ncbi:MAG: DUF2917 domain-containing protein [Roseateles sp.]
MNSKQVFPPAAQALWTLARGEALSLDIGPGPRELSVSAGRLWLTQSGELEDVWLSPGQSVLLRSGARVLMEGWPEAQFQLLVPPIACPDLLLRQLERRQQQRAATAAGAAGATMGGGLAPA